MVDAEDLETVDSQEELVELQEQNDNVEASEEELPSDRVADLVEYMVTALASKPGEISIDVTDGPDSSLIEVGVDSEDVGRIIGRHGRVIKSIRSLAHACGARLGINVEVEVVE